MKDKPVRIEKNLSYNDTGENGSHQAGMLIPKQNRIYSFFPQLSTNQKNPRCKLFITDNLGRSWTFSFIYYNNKFFGGTRNEYRLTGMTKYIRSNNLSAGDKIILSIDHRGFYSIDHEFKTNLSVDGVLKLSNKWKIVNI
ncbi:MAG: hypothetical protein K9N40_12550 [Candidatus Cloacimonetes bacterium]|nr:hypothetical protein [Candidatus Cloacimonadota bacterium]